MKAPLNLGFWSKFLSRKFLLGGAVLIMGILDATVPTIPQIVSWSIAGPIIAYIFGEAGLDIMRLHTNYKYASLSEKKEK